MARLVLGLWAFLVSAELARNLTTTSSARNLSCFQCFKVNHPSRCRPEVCHASERVCVSNELFFYSRTKSRMQISRRCAVQCPNSNSLFDWTPSNGILARITRRCCLGNLCNTAPDTQKGLRALPGALLLPVVLGLLCTLL